MISEENMPSHSVAFNVIVLILTWIILVPAYVWHALLGHIWIKSDVSGSYLGDGDVWYGFRLIGAFPEFCLMCEEHRAVGSGGHLLQSAECYSEWIIGKTKPHTSARPERSEDARGIKPSVEAAK